MNKNILIGVLVLIAAVLGLYLVKGGNFFSQEAATISSQSSSTYSIDKDFTTTISVMTASKGGKVTLLSTAQQDKIRKAIQSTLSGVVSSGSVNRPYTCAMTTSGGGIYVYSYNSLYDQGAEWHPTSGTVCYAD